MSIFTAEAEHGWQAAYWHSRRDQELVFRVVKDGLLPICPGGYSLLDVGCGYGDFRHYAEIPREKYTGIDASGPVARRAGALHADFLAATVLPVDYAVAIGTWNLETSLAYVSEAIARMFRLAGQGVALVATSSRVYSGQGKIKGVTVTAYDPSWLLNEFFKHTAKVKIDHLSIPAMIALFGFK